MFLFLKRLMFIPMLAFILPLSFALAEESVEDSDTLDQLLSMSLEELIEVEVKLATGTPKPLRLAPAIASVITAEDIAAMGATTLDEILETVPGLHVSPSGLNIFTPIWSIRGIHSKINPHVLLLIDGVPLTKLYDGGRAHSYRMPTAMISRVEVIRGPGSAVHGAYSLYQEGDNYFQLLPASYVNMIGYPRGTEKATALETTAFYDRWENQVLRLAGGIKFADLDTGESKNFGPGVSE